MKLQAIKTSAFGLSSVFFVLTGFLFATPVFAKEYESGTYSKGGSSYNCKVTCDDGIVVYLNADPCDAAHTKDACAKRVTSGTVGTPAIKSPVKAK